MITADELNDYIRTLQSAGITGRAKIGDIEITIPPVVDSGTGDAKPTARSQKADYDNYLFAATEGLREGDEEEKTS